MSELQTLRENVIKQYRLAEQETLVLQDIVQVIQEEFTQDITVEVLEYDYISHERSASVQLAFTAPNEAHTPELNNERLDLHFSVTPTTNRQGSSRLSLDMPVPSSTHKRPVLTLKLSTDGEHHQLNISNHPRHKMQKTFSRHIEIEKDTNFYLHIAKRDEILLQVYEALYSQFLSVSKHRKKTEADAPEQDT